MTDYSEQEEPQEEDAKQSLLADFPVDDLGPWPEGLALSREDIYGDDGR